MAPKTKTPDRLTVEERRELPASAFGIPETREFPLDVRSRVIRGWAGEA